MNTYAVNTRRPTYRQSKEARHVSSSRHALKLDCLTRRQFCEHVCKHLRAALKLKRQCKQSTDFFTITEGKD